ncbi:MAG: DHH family phosphoesterase [Candidatus Lokiarchaeota archaeon]|nr:DHH family phosphoesterase [Candidatus Lokiarchaeota archaeon]
MDYLDKNLREIKEHEFEVKLTQIAGNFLDLKDNLDHVLLISHRDADGYACSAILKIMLEREGINYSTRYYNRKNTWKQYLDSIIPQFDYIENLAVIFSDIGSEINELGRYFSTKNIAVFILDHHEMDIVEEEKLPHNFFFLNPTTYGYDGLKEIAGSALVYLFAKSISHNNIKTAWIALIGISNDTLMNVQDYRSYNHMVVEEAKAEEQINLKQGLMVYGATHESVKNALAYSLYPYIKEVGGDPNIAREILEQLKIPANKKVAELSSIEVEFINDRFPEKLLGKYIQFPEKKGILRYAFEHGLLISQLAFKSPHQAERLFQLRSTPIKSTEIYQNYIRNLTKNLTSFVTSPKEVTDQVLFVDATRRLSPNFWSDVASYASVNHLYDQKKVLFLGGIDGNFVKLSIRCTDQYPPLIEGKGVDLLIQKLKKIYGGMGGGHKLAGGYKIAPNRYKKLKNEIDQYFPL